MSMQEPSSENNYDHQSLRSDQSHLFFRESSRSYWLDYKNGWFLESVANLKMAGATHAETSF